MHRVLIALSLASAMLLAPTSNAFARYSALIMDATSGEILYSANAELPRYPASLTKMMTLYLLFDAIESGRVRLSDTISFSTNAVAQPPTKLGASTGERIAVETAILALVTKSANDVAAAVAEHLAGSEYTFAQSMTDQAQRLGMFDTTFQNASGLPNPDQVTTARDMAILGRALYLDFPQFYHYFSTRYFRYDGASHHNHNQLLFSYDGVDGIKTGFIRASGFNLVASATRNGRRLIGVVLGARSPGERGRMMASLFDNGFRDADTGEFQLAMARENPTQIERTVAESSTAAAVPPLRAGGASIELGTYRDRSGALNTAQRALSRVSSELAGGEIDVVAVRGKGRRAGVTYRSRIINVDAAEAWRACAVLKKSARTACSVRTVKPVTAGKSSLTKRAAVRSASLKAAPGRTTVRKAAAGKPSVAKPVTTKATTGKTTVARATVAKPARVKAAVAKPVAAPAAKLVASRSKPAVRPKP
ncbi:MAG: D-alanyl-D-alanine carboxypeptidase family protein [Defluviicoccus sp.]